MISTKICADYSHMNFLGSRFHAVWFLFLGWLILKGPTVTMAQFDPSGNRCQTLALFGTETSGEIQAEWHIAMAETEDPSASYAS